MTDTDVKFAEEALCLPGAQDWENLAKVTALNEDDLKKQYHEAIHKFVQNPVPIEVVSVSGPAKLYNYFNPGAEPEYFESKMHYQITIVPGVLALGIDIGYDLSTNWYAQVNLTAKVFNKDVGSSSFRLNAAESTVEIHPGALVAKADLKLGFYGDKLCFGVEGNACYWLFGWRCQDFNKQGLFCLRS